MSTEEAAQEPDFVAHSTTEVLAPSTEIVWKWISAVLASILLAGAPGYLYLYLNTPTNSEFSNVAKTQQEVLQRLAVLEAKLAEDP